ncbi:hypothetical protein [Streptomyces sp. NPDC048361]|uniref:hypothetical protein n=1 Tax=Streptomyces sp. NPDC048361 TaxID=3154720 RepID=UPI0034129D3B
MTNNDMPQGDDASGGLEPALPPADRTRTIVAQVTISVPGLRREYPRYASVMGSGVLCSAILSGHAPQDPGSLWALVVLSIAALWLEAWAQRGR